MLSKNAFIQLALQQNVLQWGKYTLKSGRISPYFFNAGLFYQNDAVKKLGEYYADLILEHAPEATHLFGPAYKGIPLATATAIALSERGKSLTLTFNRKEIKDHGEGGDLIGAPLNQGTTVMIDDVITAGTAFRESKTFIQKHGGQLTHVFIALDRCERGLGELSAIEEIEQQGITVHPVITLHDLIAHLQAEKQMDLAQALCAYHKKYGV